MPHPHLEQAEPVSSLAHRKFLSLWPMDLDLAFPGQIQESNSQTSFLRLDSDPMLWRVHSPTHPPVNHWASLPLLLSAYLPTSTSPLWLGSLFGPRFSCSEHVFQCLPALAQAIPLE